MLFSGWQGQHNRSARGNTESQNECLNYGSDFFFFFSCVAFPTSKLRCEPMINHRCKKIFALTAKGCSQSNLNRVSSPIINPHSLQMRRKRTTQDHAEFFDKDKIQVS